MNEKSNRPLDTPTSQLPEWLQRANTAVLGALGRLSRYPDIVIAELSLESHELAKDRTESRVD